MKIKRYDNGDICPCCGQVIEGKTREALDLLSMRIAAIGFECELDSFFPETAADWICCTRKDLRRTLAEWLAETEAAP